MKCFLVKVFFNESKLYISLSFTQEYNTSDWQWTVYYTIKVNSTHAILGTDKHMKNKHRYCRKRLSLIFTALKGKKKKNHTNVKPMLRDFRQNQEC